MPKGGAAKKFAKGDRFGCLTVIGAAPPAFQGPYHKRSRVAVQCDCGRRFAYFPSNLRLDQRHCRFCEPAKGGFIAGERHPNAKLTEAAVREIRESVHITGNELAQKFGVSVSTVSNVRTGRGWAA